MRQRVEAPVGRRIDSGGSMLPGALAWFTVALSLVVLIAGRNRVGDSHTSVAETTPRTIRGEGGTGEGMERSGGRSPPVRMRSRPARRKTLSLPLHVVAILQQSAARREAENHGTAPLDHESTVGSDKATVDGELSTALDFVVPAYDPWKSQEPRS